MKHWCNSQEQLEWGECSHGICKQTLWGIGLKEQDFESPIENSGNAFLKCSYASFNDINKHIPNLLCFLGLFFHQLFYGR